MAMRSDQMTPRRRYTRDRLLDAAVGVFAEAGFAGASVEMISDRAGYSRGAFYYNFGSKDEIFLEVMGREFDRALRMFEAGITASTAESSVAPTLAKTRAHSDDVLRARAVEEFRLHAMRDPRAARAYTDVVSSASLRLGAVLTGLAHTAGDELHAPADEVAAVLIGVYLQSVADGILAGHADETLLRFVDRRVDLVLRAVIEQHLSDGSMV